MSGSRTVAVLGPIPFDRITTHHGEVLQKYGCVLYTAAALSALMEPSDRICPVEWAEAGEHHWWMLMRCGECQSWVQGTVGNELAAVIDVELDRQQAEIAGALQALETERMAADVEAFAAALEHDLVDAEDFAR